MYEKGDAGAFFVHGRSKVRNSLAYLRALGSEVRLNGGPAQRSGPTVKAYLTGEDEASSILNKAKPYHGDAGDCSSCENLVPKAVALAEKVFARGAGHGGDPAADAARRTATPKGGLSAVIEALPHA